jgi:hypothetical protein
VTDIDYYIWSRSNVRNGISHWSDWLRAAWPTESSRREQGFVSIPPSPGRLWGQPSFFCSGHRLLFLW